MEDRKSQSNKSQHQTNKEIAEIVVNKEFLPIDISYEIRISDIKGSYKYILL